MVGCYGEAVTISSGSHENPALAGWVEGQESTR
jgi:hypothetical protein